MPLDVYKDWLGIPEAPRPPDHYQLLRLKQFEDDPEKIRAHYKKLNAHVRKYATGKYSAESQELLNELAKAMLCLTDAERKREYDESLGREFADEDTLGRKPLLKQLVEHDRISQDQAREAKEFADTSGLSHRDAVVQLKLIDAEAATEGYAEELGLPYVDLSDMLPDDAVLDQVPKPLVKRNSILPLFIDDDALLVACADQPTAELEDELRLRFGKPTRFALAAPRAIQQGIAKYYAPGMRDDAGGKEEAAPTQKKSAAKRTRMARLAPEEQQQRKQLGYIVICWSIIFSVVVDVWVLPSGLTHWGPSFLPFLVTFIVPPLAIWYVLKIYWK